MNDRMNKISSQAYTPDNSYIIDNCILTFSINSETDLPYLAADMELLKQVLIMYPNERKMDILSINLGFADYNTREINVEMPVLLMRKIYAQSYNLNVSLNENPIHSIREISETIKSTIVIFQKRQELRELLIASLSYSLFEITNVVHKSTIPAEEFIPIITTVLFFMLRTQLPQNAQPYFNVFLLKSISFINDQTNFDLVENTLLDVIKTITLFMKKVKMQYNYAELSYHVIYLLKLPFQITTRIALLGFVTSILSHESDVLGTITTKENRKIIAFFASEALQKNCKVEKISCKPFKIESLSQISDTSFDDDVALLTSQQRTLCKKDYVMNMPVPFSDIALGNLLNFVVQLFGKNLESSLEIISIVMQSQTYGAAQFTTHYISYLMKIPGFIENISKTPIIPLLAKTAYIYDEQQFKNFIFVIIGFYSTKAREKLELYFRIFDSIVEVLKTFNADDSFFDCISQSILSDMRTSLFAFEAYSFDKQLADVILYLQSIQIEKSDNFSRNRRISINFADFFFGIKACRDTLIKSQHFLNMVFHLSLETKLWTFTFGVLVYILRTSKSENQEMATLFEWFESELNSKDHEPLCVKILQGVIDSIPKNGHEIGLSVLKNRFIQSAISFATLHPTHLPLVIKIYDQMNALPDSLNDAIQDADLFGSLKTALLNSSASETAQKEVFEKDNQGIRLKSVAMASLLMRVLEGNQLVSLLTEIIKASTTDPFKAIEVTQSDIPGQLINIVESYREKDKGDELLSIALRAICFFGQTSIRPKDLLGLIKTLAVLPGDERPFFSIEVLNTLHSLFSTSLSLPYAFFRLDGEPVNLPAVVISRPFSNFTVMFDIAIFSGEGVLFEFRAQNGASFKATYKNNSIRIEVNNGVQALPGVFRISVRICEWYRIFIRCKNGFFSLFTNTESDTLRGQPVLFSGQIYGYICSNLKADVGSFTFIAEAFNDNEMYMLRAMPFVKTSLSPYEAKDYPESIRPLFAGGIYNNIIWRYMGCLTSVGCAVNMGPIQTPNIKFGNSLIQLSMRPRYLLHGVGGVRCLFPLFSQLDSALHGSESNDVDHRLLPLLIRILASLFQNSAQNQDDFVECKGCQIVSHLVSRARLGHITPEFIDSLKEMWDRIDSHSLKADMLKYIFLDMKLWIFAEQGIQLHLFDVIQKIFEDQSDAEKRWFTSVISFSYVLCVMRTSLWSVMADKDICLLGSPKIDLVTGEVEKERQNDSIVSLRNNMWKLARLIGDVRFSKKDASTLCYFSFDTHDVSQTVNTLSYLLFMIDTRADQIMSTLTNGFRFTSFFPLFVSSDQRMRGQVMHLFMRNIKNSGFLSPYSEEEWVTGIVAAMNTANTTAIFADLVLGYVFGLYGERISIMPQIRVSQVDTENQLFEIVQPNILPIALSALSVMDDTSCLHYLDAITRAMKRQINEIIRIPNFDFAFVVFVITRILKSKKKDLDTVSAKVVEALIEYYGNTRKFVRFLTIVDLLSVQTGLDLSYIKQKFIEIEMKSLNENISDEKANYIFKSAFEYLFMIPKYSSFYAFDSNNKEEIPPMEDITSFHHLFMSIFSDIADGARFTYATRTAENGSWTDSKLAERLLELMANRSGALSVPENRFIYSFTIGRGLSHKQHFESFVRHLRILTNVIAETNDSDAFINYMSGLIRTYLATDMSHTSHLYLQEDTEAFSELIFREFNTRMNWGSSLASFDSCFIQSEYNYAHRILERFVGIESKMFERAKSVEERAQTQFENLSNSTINMKKGLGRLNVEDSAEKLDAKSKQIKLTLMQFASDVRYSSAQGFRSYRRVFRALGSEGGVWANKKARYYKLGRTISRSLIRQQLVENYSYDDHKAASILRDVGSNADAQVLIEKHLIEKIKAFGETKGIVSIDAIEEVEETKTNIERDEKDTDFIIKIEARYVTPTKVKSGHIVVRRDRVEFEDEVGSFAIKASSIKYIFRHVYLMSDTAVELYTRDRRAYLFDLAQGQRADFVEGILCIAKPVFVQDTSNIFAFLEKKTEMWRKGEMTNFEYLMWVNVCAGRSYNDLAAYPVFPWVIQDYDSPVLDLDNPDTFRDMNRPIGAMNEERLADLKERLDASSVEDRFLYGSLYSSPYVVIGYMIRVEPFTSMHIELQSGRFDFADRLFSSIPKAWQSCCNTPMDFRELIPEFFFLPEIFENANGFDLGKGCDDVELPPWAVDPADFVRKNMAALECPIVSSMLPRWIDLIFGVNSRGEGAVECNNLFNPNFFQKEYSEFARENAACFGQAVDQLFFEPHRSRAIPVYYGVYTTNVVSESEKSIVCLSVYSDRAKQESGTIVVRKDLSLECNGAVEKLPAPPSTGYIVAAHGRRVVYAVPFDSAVYLHDGSLQSVRRPHAGSITCVAASRSLVASGSSDGTLAFWADGGDTKAGGVVAHPAPITAACVDEDNGVVISCSRDGTIIVTSIVSGKPLRSSSVDGVPTSVVVSRRGSIAVCVRSDRPHIASFSANLRALATRPLPAPPEAAAVLDAFDGRECLLVSAGDLGVCTLEMSGLAVIEDFDGRPCEHIAVLVSQKGFVRSHRGSVFMTKVTN